MLNEEYLIAQDCPVCISNDKKLIFKDLVHTCNVLKKAGTLISNEDATSNIYRCNKCGHKYLSPVIKNKYLNFYYEVAGSEYYDTIKDNPHDRIPSDTKKMADFIEENCKGSKSVLEIGSGMGYLLQQLKIKGFNCTGVDPSAFASDFARKEFGLEVFTTILDSNTFKNRKFDIVILCDVVEHIYEINKLISLIKAYLNSDGNIVILTGNSDSIYAKVCAKKWLYFFSWEHISFFNKKSISQLFKNHGLKLQYFKAQQHSGSIWHNSKVFLFTLKSIIANKLGFRNHLFFYMSFDHLITIGKNVQQT